MKLARLLRSAFVVGRRDFTATVMSKAFLLFLLGPLFPLAMGMLFGGIGANVASEADRSTVAVIATAAEFAPLAEADRTLGAAFPDSSLTRFVRIDPRGDVEAQRRELLESRERPVLAVASDLSGSPRLIGAVNEGGMVQGQLRLLLAQARSGPGPEIAVTKVSKAQGSIASARSLTARAGQALLFLLTLLLAGMLLSQLIEEKSNKVIEVLAAAVPVEAIFLGKLFAMLAMSLVGIAVWASVALLALNFLAPAGALAALPAPAVGWPGFVLLAILYFAAAYLLIGAAFLGIGAHASTAREVQTLSMPVTMSQVAIFALAALAVSDMNGRAGLFAAVFPLSSPYAMLARAAMDGAWWPHLAAFAWQALWIAIILRFASRLFRRSVLKSGRQFRWPWQPRAAA